MVLLDVIADREQGVFRKVGFEYAVKGVLLACQVIDVAVLGLAAGNQAPTDVATVG
ncbi:hypothetical protein D3C81_805830 [compost metagenome]